MQKRCVICGAAYQAPPSSKKITCSRDCSRTRKRRSHRGKSNRWNVRSREQLAQKGQSANLRKGTQAAQASSRSGPFDSNVNALRWTLQAPDERIYEIKNLTKFLREHAELLDGSPEQARAGIMQIRRSQQGKTPRPVSQWKGWRLLRVSAPDEE